MTTIKVPDNRGNPVIVHLNGATYQYTAGETVSVPDGVAEILRAFGAESSDTRKSAEGEAVAALSGRVGSLETRVSALDDPDTGAVAALTTRVNALEDEVLPPEEDPPEEPPDDPGSGDEEGQVIHSGG